MKSNTTLGVVAIVVVGGTLGFFAWSHLSSIKTQAAPNPHNPTTVPAPATTSVVIPGSIDPSTQWLADFDRLNDLNASLAAKRIDALTRYLNVITEERDATQRALDQYQLESDLVTGLNNRLGSQIPQGFTWDNGTRKFVPVPKKEPPNANAVHGK